MIKSADLRDALVELIEDRAGLPLITSFNYVNDPSESYAWVRLRPTRRDEGFGYMQRRIRVDIQIHLTPDENGQVKHTDILDMFDALDEATCNSIPVLDRWLVVYDAETIIFDNIGTYSFMLDFTDCLSTLPPEISEAEYMQELELDLQNWSETN